MAEYNHYHEPESQAYELRNPGLLDGEAKNDRTPEGKRIFSCHRAGYAALMDVIKKRCMLNKQGTVKNLLESFHIKMPLQQERALDFISRCTNSTVSSKTSLDWFLENGE